MLLLCFCYVIFGYVIFLFSLCYCCLLCYFCIFCYVIFVFLLCFLCVLLCYCCVFLLCYFCVFAMFPILFLGFCSVNYIVYCVLQCCCCCIVKLLCCCYVFATYISMGYLQVYTAHLHGSQRVTSQHTTASSLSFWWRWSSQRYKKHYRLIC